MHSRAREHALTTSSAGSAHLLCAQAYVTRSSFGALHANRHKGFPHLGHRGSDLRSSSARADAMRPSVASLWPPHGGHGHQAMRKVEQRSVSNITPCYCTWTPNARMLTPLSPDGVQIQMTSARGSCRRVQLDFQNSGKHLWVNAPATLLHHRPLKESLQLYFAAPARSASIALSPQHPCVGEPRAMRNSLP
jgi:hypothetical protein